MNNLQQSMLEAERLRQEAYHEWLESFRNKQPWEFDDNWLLDAEERQREYRDEADTLANLLQF